MEEDRVQKREWAKDEAAAVRWIEGVLQAQLPSNLHDSLKSGFRLLKLIHVLWPACSRARGRISRGLGKKAAFDRTVLYLSLCRRAGLKPAQLFKPEDLQQEGNITKYVTTRRERA